MPSEDMIRSLILDPEESTKSPLMDQRWILDFVSSLIHCGSYGDNNLLYHPLAVFLVVSSSDPDPIRRFDELSRKVLHIPAILHGTYSRAIPFFYFLLHKENSSSNVNEIFRAMKSSFNAIQCKLIRINYLPVEASRSSSPAPFSDLYCSCVC